MSSALPPPVLPPQRFPSLAEDSDPRRTDTDASHDADGRSTALGALAGGAGVPTASHVSGAGRRSAIVPTRLRRGDVPPYVPRPTRIAAFRIVVAALGFMGVVLSWHMAANADGGATDTSLRRAGLVVAIAYGAAHTVFATWTYRYRLIIDDLRWQLHRRTSWRGAWAVGWSLTFVTATSFAAALAVAEAHVVWYVVAGAVVVGARISMLTTLGANLARVVLGARRRLTLWGGAIAVADLLVVGVAVTAFVEIEPERTTLVRLAGWAVFALVAVGIALLSYMKRTERWTLSWWAHRHDPIQPDPPLPSVLTAGRATSGRVSRLGPIPARELLPVLVLRYVVVVSYWIVAATALRAGVTVGLLRGELTLASDTAAAVDRLERSIQPFIVAIVAMQVAQGLWSVVQARVAQRATLVAPNAVVMGALFAAGPVVLVYGLIAHPGNTMLFAVLALLLNLSCWVASFGAFSTTIQDLGRSARAMATWSVVVSIHWVLGFALAPLSSLDDDMWFAVAIVVLSLVDAAIVVLASVQAWHAMRGMELAVRDRAGVDGTVGSGIDAR